MSSPVAHDFQPVADQLLQPFDWRINKKDILGFRSGRLLVLFPVGKGAAGVSGWLCRCDCGTLRTVCTASLRKGDTKSCGCLRYKYATGRRFGKLTVVRRASSTARGKSTWECLCDCGNTVVKPLKKLTDGCARSCGCAYVRRLPGTTKLDITGQVFGRLTALQPDGKKPRNTNGTYWVCACSCGNESSVAIGKLRSGHTKSCGCLIKSNPGSPRLPDRIVRGVVLGGASKVNTLFSNYRRLAEQRRYKFELSCTEFAGLIARDCVYCGSPPAQPFDQNAAGGLFYRNGVDRADNALGYTTDNCVPCCKHCNLAKNSMSKDEFLAHVLRIIKHSNLCRAGVDHE